MKNKTIKTLESIEPPNWKLILKLLGGVAVSLLGAVLSIISPPAAIVAILWGIIWILQALAGFVRKFRQSKIYPKIKETIKKVLIFLLVCSIIVTLFNFIAGLSATTIILILLILILLK